MVVLLLFSCKKGGNDTYNIKISAILAHNNVPIEKIKWVIVESETNTPAIQGYTNSDGKSEIDFPAQKGVSYWMYIYYDEMIVPPGNYKVVQGPDNLFGLIQDGNNIEIRILPYMDINVHYKNYNCFDNGDTFKYKNFNVDEYRNFTQGQVETMPWGESSLLNGCSDFNTSGDVLAGRHIYIWEATRNNITTTGVDTFYVEPGGNNLIEMFW